MELHEFESLWPRRASLTAELVEQLETMRRTNPDARAFADGGSTVRDTLQSLGEVKVPENFAYKMRVYAQNHPQSSPVWEDRPLLRWWSLGAGVATGAIALFLLVGPLGQYNPANEDGVSLPMASEIPVDAPDSSMGDDLMLNEDANLAEQANDSTFDDSQSKSMVNDDQWNLHAVSVEQ